MDQPDYRQQQEQENLELHQMTVEALLRAQSGQATGLDVALLCYHCGIDYEREILSADHERR